MTRTSQEAWNDFLLFIGIGIAVVLMLLTIVFTTADSNPETANGHLQLPADVESHISIDHNQATEAHREAIGRMMER